MRRDVGLIAVALVLIGIAFFAGRQSLEPRLSREEGNSARSSEQLRSADADLAKTRSALEAETRERDATVKVASDLLAENRELKSKVASLRAAPPPTTPPVVAPPPCSRVLVPIGLAADLRQSAKAIDPLSGSDASEIDPTSLYALALTKAGDRMKSAADALDGYAFACR